MENADEDLTKIEDELRALAAADRASRPEDAALLARLCERADAACEPRTLRPWYRSPMMWRSAAALALLAALPALWQFAVQPDSRHSAITKAELQSESAPMLATAAMPMVDALPEAGGGVPEFATQLETESAPMAVAALTEEMSQESVPACEAAVAVCCGGANTNAADAGLAVPQTAPTAMAVNMPSRFAMHDRCAPAVPKSKERVQKASKRVAPRSVQERLKYYATALKKILESAAP